MITKTNTIRSICLVLITMLLFCMFITGCRQLDNNPDRTDGDSLDNGTSTDEPSNPNDSKENDSSNNSFNEETQGSTPSQGNDNSPNNDSAEYIDVGTAASDVMSSYAISCKLPTKYSTTHVSIPLSISFGLVEGCDADTDLYTDIILRVDNNDGESIVIKQFNIYEILNSEYTVKSIWDENHEWVIDFNYTHTESFDLPLSLFSGDSGQICIGLYECSNNAPGNTNLGSGAYIILLYTRNETSISISADVRTG